MPGNSRILYVDDDAALRRLVQRALERRGFDVVPAESADAALEILNNEEIALVAIDHEMPGRDGLSLLADIVAMDNAPPAVFVTGTDETRIAVAALKSGASDFVVKTIGNDFFDLLAGSFTQALEKVALTRAKALAELELRAANERLELILGEIHHRIANSLAIVSTFVSMQARASDDPATSAALAETNFRIQAVAQVHRRLYTSPSTNVVELDDYLASLIDELRSSVTTDRQNVVLRLDADPVEIKPDHAVSIGVIVAELVSNAMKYAFVAGASGEINVTLRDTGNGGFNLQVTDNGQGFTLDQAATGSGLGMRIVKAMAAGLSTELVQSPCDIGSRLALDVPPPTA
ncbi:response regulator [Croceicoccus ponticola]|uniref:histidine kinase n=1 Tax=Croceicoccus ponticola TaxID=2217664 RepID=A0A437H0E8_9SPHN|nr:response regulator [Croceicoccus ponticola]RVQ69098.1 response regulator [Croceicoccus ponticola]